MKKTEDAESMIATTIGRLEVAMKSPAILHAATIKAIKDDLCEWFEARPTTNISDSCAVSLIRELIDRNDDASYRQAVKEIIEQCDSETLDKLTERQPEEEICLCGMLFKEHNQLNSNHSPVSAKSDIDWSSLAETEMKNLLDAHEALNREELGKALQRIRILVGR